MGVCIKAVSLEIISYLKRSCKAFLDDSSQFLLGMPHIAPLSPVLFCFRFMQGITQ